MQERLQKIISRAGVASRRKAEELIRQGQVTVNGRMVTELGTKADGERDHIKVAGKLLSRRGERVYLALNKPRECVSTTSDPEGRRTVLDLVGRYRTKVYPVGRLDYHSEGLLLLTNDGDFANHILSAKNEIPKTYQVKVNGRPTPADFQKFRNGIRLDGRMTAPAKIRLSKPGENPWYEVTITEGRQNQVRRMFKSLGFLVEKLRRVKIGTLPLDKLPLGTFRELTPAEVKRLLKPSAADDSARPVKGRKPQKTAEPRGFARSQRDASSKRTTGNRHSVGNQRERRNQHGAGKKRPARSVKRT